MLDGAVASAIALIRAGITVDEAELEPGQIASQIVLDEFALLGGAQRQWLAMQLGDGPVAVRGTEFRPGITSLFSGATTTRANLLGLVRRTGARWEELGWDRAPNASDVANARRLP